MTSVLVREGRRRFRRRDVEETQEQGQGHCREQPQLKKLEDGQGPPEAKKGQDVFFP